MVCILVENERGAGGRGGGEGIEGDRWRVCKYNPDEKNLNGDGNEKMGIDSKNRKREVR